MVLDCDIELGGYVGSCMGNYIKDIQKQVSEGNKFSEDGSFIKACKQK